MHFKKIHIQNLDQFQSSVIEQLPKDAFVMTGVMTQWHTHLITIPEIQNLINELNYGNNIINLAIVTMPPQSELPIHIDGGQCAAALNIPLLNYTGTYTNWYSSNQPLKEYAHHGQGTYFGAEKESCTKIATVEMDSPCIIDIRTLHSASNPLDTWRILLSLRLIEYQF